MKFILHNLRMIWARLSNSGWVLAELFLVFIVMWFLCDSLGCMKYTFYRPLGYDIDHVYRLTTVQGGESRDTALLDADKYLNILKRLEQEPTVEAASLSYWSLPMSGANSYNSLAVQDTIGQNGRMIYATGGYTRVFHMQEEQGRTFAALPIGINNVMLSQAIADAFKERLPEFSLNTPMKWRGDTVNTVTFLLGNVFLGLIGTFWVRTRRRRSEIALRLAMGSTKHQVFSLLMGEGLLLLALVTLPAMLVCYNVGVGEFTIGRTALIATWPVEWSMIRFLIGSLGAWLLIALMVMMGIWYPARQAMKIEPAEALHEE